MFEYRLAHSRILNRRIRTTLKCHFFPWRPFDGLREHYFSRSNVKGPGSRMDHLLRESESARNSERLIDEQINIAIESRETLARQRLAFKAMRTKVRALDRGRNRSFFHYLHGLLVEGQTRYACRLIFIGKIDLL